MTGAVVKFVVVLSKRPDFIGREISRILPRSSRPLALEIPGTAAARRQFSSCGCDAKTSAMGRDSRTLFRGPRSDGSSVALARRDRRDARLGRVCGFVAIELVDRRSRRNEDVGAGVYHRPGLVWVFSNRSRRENPKPKRWRVNPPPYA